MYKVWVNINADGMIIGAYGGYAGVAGNPLDSYQYEFEVSEEVYKTIGNYKVVNGQLVLK